MPEQPVTFARDATGLVKEFSPLITLITTIVLTNYGLGLATYIPYSPYLYPGSDLGTAALLAIPFVLVLGLLYVWFTMSMPRSGGEYVWISRITHPAIALGFGFLFVFYQAMFWGSLLNYTISYLLGGGVASIGYATSNQSMISAAAFYSTPLAIIGLGTILVIVMFLITAAPIRLYLSIQPVLWALGMVAIILSLGAFVVASRSGFESTFNSVFASYDATYGGIISKASSLGFSNPGLVTFGLATFSTIAFAFISIQGFQFGAYFGGEMRNVRRTMTIAALAGGVFSALVYAAYGYISQGVMGASFMNAISYLQYGTSSYSLPVPWNNFFFSMLLLKNPVLIGITVVGLVAWGISGAVAIALIDSRIMFAWGFDRAVSAKISYVSDRLHTPVVALVIFAVLIEIGLVLSVYGGVIFSFLNITLVLTALFAFVGFVAVIFPYRRMGVFETSPVSKYKVGSIPAISLLGGLCLVMFSFLTYYALLNPAAEGPTSAPALASLVVIFLIGAGVYFLSRAYYRSKGIDISRAFAEIPPE